jgi:hypothetical protein
MKKIEKKDLWLLLAQVVVWGIIVLALPLATFLSTQNFESTKTSFRVVISILQSPLVIYFANFYILGPFLFFRRRYWLFALANLVLILTMNYPFPYVWFARD